MGNKLGKRLQVLDEKYTRPQGLYQHMDVDSKKLRKLILDSKLAPCYLGNEDTGTDLDECPICFLFYPSLNRSRCCMKGICTECFLQMKTPNSTRPTQCPFCKTSNYAVEYRGVKSKEEKGMEQIEEQRVIEAKIRMRQQEVRDDEMRMQNKYEMNSANEIMVSEEVEYKFGRCPKPHGNDEETVSSQGYASMVRQPSRSMKNRENEFDLDLEDVMIMEAIWLSIQDNGRHKNVVYCDSTLRDQFTGDCSTQTNDPSSSPSCGLACAIAALAERQQTNGESSNIENSRSQKFSLRIRPEAENYTPENITIEESNNTIRDVLDSSEYKGKVSHEEVDNGFEVIIPESFEEQMMLAMAVSLAEV